MSHVRTSNSIIENQLHRELLDLERHLKCDFLTYLGPIEYTIDDSFRDILDSRKNKRDKLSVILQTTGGFITVADRIVTTLRRNYKEVEFFVPNHAMSAGTVLVMSGDAIHMDYYSILGPIDPQVRRPGGIWVPALGYLAQYDKLYRKAVNNTITAGELEILLNFDQAELHQFKQEAELSVTLLKKWLANYKFKNWKKTATRHLTVTQKMREKRAAEIAKTLNSTEKWHSHGRGIHMGVLQEELNLVIEDFGSNPELADMVRSYYRLLVDYTFRRQHPAVLHYPKKYIALDV